MERSIPPLAAILVVAIPLASSAQQLPAPTGPAPVGTMAFQWTDSARAEVVELAAYDSAAGRFASVPAGGSRTLAVQIWYPAAAAHAQAAAPYNPDIESFVPVIRDSARVALYRSTATHAAWDAPLAPGDRLPVLVFSPGGGTFRADYTALYEDLASHGYVVVAVAHPGITLLSLGNGRIGTEWRGWRPPEGMSMSLEPDSLRVSAEYYARTRDRHAVDDVRFVLDRLRGLDRGDDGGRFTGRLDLERIGAFGHSTGGAVVSAAAHADSRIRALLVYDVILPRVLFGEDVTVPFMLMRTDDRRYPPGWQERQAETFAHVRAAAYDLVLRGGGHNSFSDRALLAPARYAYPIDAGRAIEIVRSYTRAFFDAHLLGRPADRLQSGNAPPEVTLVTHPPGQ